jgi:hypothetical protein
MLRVGSFVSVAKRDTADACSAAKAPQSITSHAGCVLHLPQFRVRGQPLGIDQKGDGGCVRDDLHKSLEPRRFQVGAVCGKVARGFCAGGAQ